jgi:hypothetical protein
VVHALSFFRRNCKECIHNVKHVFHAILITFMRR